MKLTFTLITALLLAPLAGLVSAQTKAPAKPDPNFIASPAELKARIPKQLRITKPDFVVFVPEVTDAGVNDTGNEHFLVFDGPDGSIMAVWTQSSAEAQPDQHIAFARSTDEGKTWSKPRIIAGPKKPGDGLIASWAYPLVSKSGRIYVLYSQHIGRHDAFVHCTGWLHGIRSDDNGATWSKPQNIPVARSINDNPDPTMPPNMLCWQKPLRLGKDGKYFAGFTRWTSFDVRKNPTKSWISADTRVEFMRFENVDDNPAVQDLKISWFAANEKALAVPFPGYPEVSACQEPTVVKLPDGRLFCVMRTASGSPFWSVSSDVGETWTQPRRLLRKDGGEPLLHPLSPCPMYDVGGNEAGSGRYALFIHNHDGHYKNYGPTDSNFHRRPIHLVPGHFKAGADQPVWFDEPKFFMDHDGVSLGKPGTNGRLDLALYSSFTVRNGKPVLWYPERKFFLLGRIIGNETMASGEPLIYQSSPDMAREYHAHATAGALELAGDSAIKPENASSLKITAREATGFVGSGRFTLKGNRENNFGAVYTSARFFVKTSPDFRGSYDMRIFVPDPQTPENSFAVPLRHFKAHAKDGSVVNGFQLTHKELCVIGTANPNQLWKGTNRAEGCEVRVYLEKASGTLWLSDVAIGRARPAWSKESWEQFEQAAGEQIVLSQGNLIQPMYERSLDHASPAVMDTVHKLLRVAGLNAVSEWIGWGDDFGRRGFDAIFRIEASSTPTPGGGNADYAASLDQLAAHVDNARYYGLRVGIMLQGTPDWTHPGRYNNRTPHSDFKDPLHNPGSASNSLPDPYPSPQVFTFESDQSVREPRNYCQYPPDHWPDWEDLARALVTRLKGKVLYYEIGNEIDCHDQGRPVGGYVTALEFLRRFHDVARRIDPQAAVVSPDASWSQMLPAMIANGMANHCDWVGFHSYHKTEGYERVRRVVEAGGVRKHLFATEGPMLREAWIGKLRGQSLWTACSLLPDNPKLPCQYFVYLKNAQGKRALAADPKGSGDRVDWKEGLYDWGCASGKLERGNFDGASKPDRIRVSVPARVTVAPSGTATIVLTATNKSSTTYTNVRLWPIGFVDALGFDRESLRASDRTIPAFRPGQTETVQMQVKPRNGGAFPARGTYRIGLAVINDEGAYSIAAGDLEVAAAGSNK